MAHTRLYSATHVGETWEMGSTAPSAASQTPNCRLCRAVVHAPHCILVIGEAWLAANSIRQLILEHLE